MLTAQDRHRLRHKTNAAIGIPSSSQKCESSSMKGLLCKLSQRTEAAIARAEIVVTDTANLRNKYAGEARIGLGDWKKLLKRTIRCSVALKQVLGKIWLCQSLHTVYTMVWA